mmetsp:Transcript_31975/g.42351  ORF Transcript_31975/g.42351 Transcript_31975/m.42351 type:complete len:92 (-) Transcript_31975:1087-1362(-)
MQIDSQKKYNDATKWKFKLFSIATCVLMVILSIQAVQSDSYLRSIFTKEKIQKKSTEIIEGAIDMTSGTIANGTEWIGGKITETQQYIIDQ